MVAQPFDGMTETELRQMDEHLLEMQNMSINNGEFEFANELIDKRTELAMYCDEQGVSL